MGSVNQANDSFNPLCLRNDGLEILMRRDPAFDLLYVECSQSSAAPQHDDAKFLSFGGLFVNAIHNHECIHEIRR